MADFSFLQRATALLGQSWKRLAAFAELQHHATLNATAVALGLPHKTLVRYVSRLERELGLQLVHRATTVPRAITSLTTTGHTIATTITKVLAQRPELGEQ